MKRIIVVGGLSAGPSAAAKARRENENAKIILFEKGANISYATCGIPYAFSGIIETRDRLMVVKPELLTTRFNIDVHLNEEIVRIDSKAKKVYSNKASYDYDVLIFVTGASSIVPPIENIKLAQNWSTCRSMKDFDKITKEGLIDTSKNITIIGAGLIGVEVAENLRHTGKNVTLIEGATHILNMWQRKFGDFAERVMSAEGIEVLTNTLVSKFNIDDEGKILSVVTKEGKTIPTDFVVLSTGIKPNTELLLKEGANAIDNGALKVNTCMETSIKDVYAAGDNVSLKNLQTNEYDYFPLGTHSNKGGRTAGANTMGRGVLFKGAYKTAIVKVFDYTLARTGMNAAALTEKKIPFKTVMSVAGSTPSYYPGQKDLVSEVYFCPSTKEIFGAELFGEVGVDKRIDVLSTAIYAKLKITELAQLDLAYAPPFSPAKDPLVVTSHIAENIINNGHEQISVEALEELFKTNAINDVLLIDTRTDEEYRKGSLPGAIHYPLDSLRADVKQLKHNHQKVIVFCQKGVRGYLAQLILKSNGLKEVLNVAGGFKVWQMYSNLIEIPEIELKGKI